MDNSSEDTPLRYHPSKVAWATAQFVARPPSMFASWYTYLILLAIPALLTGAYFWHVPIGINAQGTLVPREPMVTVGITHDARVTQVHVKNSQAVAQGELLFNTHPASAYHAPVAGMVLGTTIKAGAFVQRGEFALTLMPMDSALEVETRLPNQLVRRIGENKTVLVSWEDPQRGESRLHGTIREITPIFSENRRMLEDHSAIRISFASEAPPMIALNVGQPVGVRFMVSEERLLRILVRKILNHDDRAQ